METKNTWVNCVLAILTLQAIIIGGFVVLYFGIKKLGLNQDSMQFLLLALIIGFGMFSCCAIFAGKESLNKFFEYQKMQEDRKKEESKLSQRLLELISKEISIRKHFSDILHSKNDLKLSVKCFMSNED
jgi:hypothetical protein